MAGHVHMGISHPLEMAETVLEVADIAWNAMELRHRLQHHHHEEDHDPQEESNLIPNSPPSSAEAYELASLRDENRRLRSVLRENLKLIQSFAHSLSIDEDCPTDLYTRLAATVESGAFLTQLESLQKASLNDPSNHFPFNKATGADVKSAEILVNVGVKEPSLWVWVVHEDMLNDEESSGIDDEAYVIVNEELVVDGVANFIARCILSNPKSKSLKPEELQKTVAKALGGMNKIESMFKIWHAGKILFALSTWGFTLAGLYRHGAILRIAAKGIATTGNVILKAL